MADLKVGQTVELADGRIAVVRFIGQPLFAAGEWVGVELEDESGKNDGSVQGERYFECKMGKGMFVRPAAVAVIASTPAPAAPPPRSNGQVKKTSRPNSVVPSAAKRLGSIDVTAGRRGSVNAPSPSPAGRRPSSILRSPAKSPTKQLTSGAASASTTSRTGTPSHTRTVSTTATRSTVGSKRTSMAPPTVPSSRTTRQSTVGSSISSTRTGVGAARTTRPSLAPKVGSTSTATRMSSISSQLSAGSGTGDGGAMNSPGLSDETDTLSTKALSPALSRISAADRPGASPTTSSRGPNSPAAQRHTATSTAASRKLEDLETKLRLMEKKRLEDREKLKALEKVQAERDKFESIIQKLQAKYQPQQQEITDLRKELKEFASKFEEVENMQAEHDIALEMATLDREMAEETAEVLKTELDALKLKTEELELEVDVLREENAELGGEMSPEEKSSQGWLQMERNNERLREALIRLRDITQQQESELKDQIKSLEEDVREFGSVKEHYEAAKERLAKSEATVEDLRQQLDNALGAEDMIEELTERNMSMSEQIEELKVTVEDLESLKELNDELEINHIETEKDMQEEIDFKDSVISEQARRAAQQDEKLEDLEYTLVRFRELVTNLQTDLEDMRASNAVNESESEQLESRSRAMMDLNMKLQVSAAKTQVKTIDLELRRLDAQEASDHLAIVQLFLPEAFQTEKDSILALLRFKRVAFKADLLHVFVKERINGHMPHAQDSDVFAACDVLDKLAWISAMCDRFVSAISHCSVEQFARYEGAMYELEPVERALNGWIDGLRRDELKEKLCADELQRSIALLSHLAEVHIPAGLESYADDVHMKALVMQSRLENTASALAAAKLMVLSIVPSQGDEDELAQHFSKKSDAIISQTRSAKVVIGKAVRSLEDLRTRSLSLMPETLEHFEICEAEAQELAEYSHSLGTELSALLHEDGRTEPFTYVEVQSLIQLTTSNIFATTESDLFSTFANKLRLLTNSLADLAVISSDLEQTQEFERAPAPWVLRSQELRSSRVVSIDAEEEMRRLKEDYHERARLIAMRDQTLEEAGVKIELLESRMRDATKKNERISELERKIEEAKKREVELVTAVEGRDKELASLEADRDKWRKTAGEAQAIGTTAPGSKAGQERAVATAREMDELKTEIASLQAAVRYLREDNRLARLDEPYNAAWLSEPLIKPKSQAAIQKDLVIAEGQDVLNELLNLAKDAKLYDLASMPKNKLAWRPAKNTPQYHVAKQREDYEAWSAWQDAVTKKAQEYKVKDDNTRLHKKKRGKLAARVDFRLPGMDSKVLGDGEVEIIEPGDFEQMRERLGFV